MGQNYIKVNASEISPEDLRVMIASQSKLNALAEMAAKARSCKADMTGTSFRETFLVEVKNIIS